MILNLSSATEVIMGCEGLKKRTALQCLHSAYKISLYRKGEREAVWTLINTQDCKKLASPMLSLWECVFEAYAHVIENYKQWKKFVNHVMSVEKVTQ